MAACKIEYTVNLTEFPDMERPQRFKSFEAFWNKGSNGSKQPSSQH